MTNVTGFASPHADRIVSLDVLRGFALLGILLMNIQSFSMPGAAYLNPTAYGDLTGVNLWTWVFKHLFADQKFMSIFSMLFGAGVCLFAERAEQKAGQSAGLHYRRMFWLLVFGLMHAYLLWYGDILVAYALCGLWVYLLRNRNPLTLILLGLIFVSISSLLSFFMGLNVEHFPADAIDEMMAAWLPDATSIATELETYRSGWLTQMPLRAEDAFFLETFVFLTVFLWRAGGMMLIGMALYKWGVLNAARSTRTYWFLLFVAGIPGLVIIGAGLQQHFANDFRMQYSMHLGAQYNYWGSALVALAYVALVMLVVRASAVTWLQSRLAAVGKTAFSNYILQSVVCTLLFYGHGAGLFGHIERFQQLLIVLGIWVLQLWLAPLWLERFRYGPLEWLWRTLTYWRVQPLLRHT